MKLISSVSFVSLILLCLYYEEVIHRRIYPDYKLVDYTHQVQESKSLYMNLVIPRLSESKKLSKSRMICDENNDCFEVMSLDYNIYCVDTSNLDGQHHQHAPIFDH